MTPPAPRDNPDWFREPTRREHAIAGWLFLGFAVFFLALAVLWRGVWFGWVAAGLGVWSIVVAAGHWRDRSRAQHKTE
jgi:hypothetical protein